MYTLKPTSKAPPGAVVITRACWLVYLVPFPTRSSSVNFGGKTFLPENYGKLTKCPNFTCPKNYQNARILHDNCPKNVFSRILWGHMPLPLPSVSYAYAWFVGYTRCDFSKSKSLIFIKSVTDVHHLHQDGLACMYDVGLCL